MTVATAPGKLVVSGDYAVLQGAPAIAVSVDVRARAQVDAIRGHASVFIDLAGGKAHDFLVEPGLPLAWTGDSPRERGDIVAAVFDTCHELSHVRGPLPALRVSVNTDAFFTRTAAGTAKLGLGSSAAALVALTGALLDALEIPVERRSLLNVCHAAHRAFQRGRGSGVDVAAAMCGGVVSIRRSAHERYPVTEELAWPEGLLMLPVWSGSSASTVELVGRFEDFRTQQPEAFRHHLRNLSTFAGQTDAAWRAGTVPEILSALAGYDDALRSFDYDAQIGINTDAHERARGLVERHGAVYKTSGAGGGDFGLVLSDSADVLDSVTAELQGTPFVPLHRGLAVPGLDIVPGNGRLTG